jgi:hypothetical protein
VLRLHKFKDGVLRFLVEFEVPFTNDLAEQALRVMKVKIKMSGGFRTSQGAQPLPPGGPPSPQPVPDLLPPRFRRPMLPKHRE